MCKFLHTAQLDAPLQTAHSTCITVGGNASTVIGTIKTGTPGPGTPNNNPCSRDGKINAGFYQSDFTFSGHTASSSNSSHPSTPRFSNGCEMELISQVACQKCGEQFGKMEALETHHFAKHVVTELLQGDSSRNIVEIIFRTSWLKTEIPHGRIERVLKVHNMQKTLESLEEFRDMIKSKASKLPEKNLRCWADGNELLRFHGTTIMCSLGTNGSSSLCKLEGCNVCRIIRTRFSAKEPGCRGIYTTATSGLLLVDYTSLWITLESCQLLLALTLWQEKLVSFPVLKSCLSSIPKPFYHALLSYAKS